MHGFMARMRFRRDHRWAPARMSDYLDGELPGHGRGRMERHVGECTECRRLLTGLRALLDALHRLPAPEAGARAVQLAASVRVRLHDPPAS
jgi:anti-sigma factor RsiW